MEAHMPTSSQIPTQTDRLAMCKARSFREHRRFVFWGVPMTREAA